MDRSSEKTRVFVKPTENGHTFVWFTTQDGRCLALDVKRGTVEQSQFDLWEVTNIFNAYEV